MYPLVLYISAAPPSLVHTSLLLFGACPYPLAICALIDTAGPIDLKVAVKGDLEGSVEGVAGAAYSL